ncbi:DNA-binding response regulator [Streptomyces sp. CB02959]|nr:DNA-binding response regulator [Streptomyces sp. CB02959]
MVLAESHASPEIRREKPVRVAIADHQEFARVGIGALLERGKEIQVVGVAEDSSGALDLVATERPDVLLMDASLPPKGWREVSSAVHRAGPRRWPTRMMVMVDRHTDDLLLSAMRGGVTGYVLKDSPDWILSTAIRSVAEGDTFLAGSVIRRLFSGFTLLPNDGSAGLAAELAELNERELHVVRGIGSGLSNREISRRLGVAENTVKSYVSVIMAKLKVRNRVEVALTACRLGLVPLRSFTEAERARNP